MSPIIHLRPADIQGLSRLATEGVTGVTDLVEAVHATVARTLTRAAPADRTRGITRLVYGSIGAITRGIGSGVNLALSPVSGLYADRASSLQRDALLAVLNGILGDHLDATGNPLALPMTLHQATHGPKPGAATGKLMILIHGLCMNHRQWSSGQVEHLARQTGHAVACLHYNSGRPIAVNGRDFAELIEALVRTDPDQYSEITLIGHSMGGLIARSAIAAGLAAGHEWPRRIGHLACLGSPHRGAPLERGGHGIDRLLALSRFTHPFARLGHLRSAGITDLRHGRLQDAPPGRDDNPAGADERSPSALRVLLIAGQYADPPDGDWVGDGLVPVESALDSPATGQPDGPLSSADRVVLDHCGHLGLVSDARVFKHIRQWIMAPEN